jgi:DNA-binding MarR family transcriptional regulator
MARSLAVAAGPTADEHSSPSPEEFAALARFRQSLRQFMAFSERAAADMGMTTQGYQALLAIKTRGAERPVSVGELAEELLIKDHSAAELVSRLAEAKLVLREVDPSDRRRSLLMMTPLADRALAKLAAVHLARLREDRDAFLSVLHDGED